MSDKLAELEKICKTCKFWDSKDVILHYRSGYHGCRKTSPTGYYESENTRHQAIWPYTKENDWCGEYEVNCLVRPWSEVE